MRKNGIKDLNGRCFGRLTVMYLVGTNRHHKAVWKCRCRCGQTVDVIASKLISGWTSSCGCFKRERCRASKMKHGHAAYRTKSAEYQVWVAMIRRCKKDKRYTSRGILVCARWLSFSNFISDMGRRPSSYFSIERIDNNKGYTPSNCKWATFKQQARNTQRTRKICFKGERKSLAEWVERFRLSYHTVKKRLNRGWPVVRAFTARRKGA